MSITTMLDIMPSSAKKAGKKAVEPTITSEEGKIKADFRYKKGGTVKKCATGGVVDKFDPNEAGERSVGKGEHAVQKRGRTKGKMLLAGGSVRSYAKGGGVESRGKTRGKFI